MVETGIIISFMVKILIAFGIGVLIGWLASRIFIRLKFKKLERQSIKKIEKQPYTYRLGNESYDLKGKIREQLDNPETHNLEYPQDVQKVEALPVGFMPNADVEASPQDTKDNRRVIPLSEESNSGYLDLTKTKNIQNDKKRKRRKRKKNKKSQGV